MIFPLISASITLDEVVLNSTGLMSSISFSSLDATCDNFTVDENYIYIGNLYFENPESCSNRDGIIPTTILSYNLTTANTDITDLQLPYDVCDTGSLAYRYHPFHAGYIFLIAIAPVISIVMISSLFVFLVRRKITLSQFLTMLISGLLAIWVGGLFIVAVAS